MKTLKHIMLICLLAGVVSILSGCEAIEKRVMDAGNNSEDYKIVYLEEKEKGDSYGEFTLPDTEKLLLQDRYVRTDTKTSSSYRTYQKKGKGFVTIIRHDEQIDIPGPLNHPESEQGYIAKNVYLTLFKNSTNDQYHATLISGNTKINIVRKDKQELAVLIGEILKVQPLS